MSTPLSVFLFVLFAKSLSTQTCPTTDIVLPNLPYDYKDLEPVISEQIMRLHHTKHHQGYINNYNAAIKQLQIALEQNNYAVVETLQNAIKFNLGGHLNHALFWTVLAPTKSTGGVLPDQTGDFANAVNEIWGSIDNFITVFSDRGAKIQGSGWVWLVVDTVSKKLSIKETPNQDSVIPQGSTPIFGIDVWEHAYYLQYLNVRGDYLKNIWKIVNWKQIETNYLIALN